MAAFQAFKGMELAAELLFCCLVSLPLIVFLLSGGELPWPSSSEPWPAVITLLEVGWIG